VDIDPLDTDGSLTLLRQFLDESRWASEHRAVHELAQLCDGLPLALSLVGARLATRPQRRVSREVNDLRSERRRLTALSRDEEFSVQAVFDVSYQVLAPQLARLYRVCALHPGPHFGVDAIAAAVREPAEDTEDHLDKLAETHLLIEIGDQRYRFHDLVRLHAHGQADRYDDLGARDEATRRMIEWYLDTAVSADLLVHPLRDRLGSRYHHDQPPTELFHDERDALVWLESERVNLFAALRAANDRRLDDLVWQFCEALWGWFLHYRHYDEWINVHTLGIAAARHADNRLAEARLHSQLGYAYVKIGRYGDAVDENTIALGLAQTEGDEATEATALSQLGRAATCTGDLDAALDYYIKARDLQAELGIVRGVGLCQRDIGEVLIKRGRYEEATRALSDSLTVMRELADWTQYARALRFLAIVHTERGQPKTAVATLTEALELMRDKGSPYYQADLLYQLGETMAGMGDAMPARGYLTQARDLYAEIGDPIAQVIQARLADLDQSATGA
ncbi:MAG TPA: tetratricopeptide repeat protein, partial [Pseudonocardiaceae bacterium]|nr:tetratricopeptide repeat protein [Pseudonocardiaceae bacterium]